jgi:hypothetical protein
MRRLLTALDAGGTVLRQPGPRGPRWELTQPDDALVRRVPTHLVTALAALGWIAHDPAMAGYTLTDAGRQALAADRAREGTHGA